MDFLATLAARNAAFAEASFNADINMLPAERTIIIGCVDPRVDPFDVLQLKQGEAAVIRNIGGRVNPALFRTLSILGAVAKAGGTDVGAGWNLVVLHHTDCGIVRCYHHAPDLLADDLGVAPSELGQFCPTDPYAAVAVDVAALRNHPDLPASIQVSGLVYDVRSGKISTVVTAPPLSSAEPQPQGRSG